MRSKSEEKGVRGCLVWTIVSSKALGSFQNWLLAAAGPWRQCSAGIKKVQLQGLVVGDEADEDECKKWLFFGLRSALSPNQFLEQIYSNWLQLAHFFLLGG